MNQMIVNDELISLNEFMKEAKYRENSQELITEIEEQHKVMMLVGQKLVDQCNKFGYTSKREKFGLYPALSYAMDIKVKLVLPYREKYQEEKIKYLKLASKLNSTKGWVSLVELTMLEKPDMITNDIFQQWLETGRTLEVEE